MRARILTLVLAGVVAAGWSRSATADHHSGCSSCAGVSGGCGHPGCEACYTNLSNIVHRKIWHVKSKIHHIFSVKSSQRTCCGAAPYYPWKKVGYLAAAGAGKLVHSIHCLKSKICGCNGCDSCGHGSGCQSCGGHGSGLAVQPGEPVGVARMPFGYYSRPTPPPANYSPYPAQRIRTAGFHDGLHR